jgi:hypothetical protein
LGKGSYALQRCFMVCWQIEKRPILNTNLFISLVQIIKENQSGIRNTSGTQLKNPVTDTVVYTPPEGKK